VNENPLERRKEENDLERMTWKRNNKKYEGRRREKWGYGEGKIRKVGQTRGASRWKEQHDREDEGKIVQKNAQERIIVKGRSTGREEQQKRGTVGKIGTSVGRTKDTEEQGKRRTVKMETGEETGAERNLGGGGAEEQ
jgi:hypothetical protein